MEILTEKEVVRVRRVAPYAKDLYKVVKLSKHLSNQKDAMSKAQQKRGHNRVINIIADETRFGMIRYRETGTRNLKVHGWTYPWISPTTVTGALTCTTFDSLINTSFVRSHISRTRVSCSSCFRSNWSMQESKLNGAILRILIGKLDF